MSLPQLYAVKIDNDHPSMDRVWDHFRKVQEDNQAEHIFSLKDLNHYDYIIIEKGHTHCGNVNAMNIHVFVNEVEDYHKYSIYTVDEFIHLLSTDDYKIIYSDNYNIF